MAELAGTDLARVRALRDEEDARFVAERPLSLALQAQARRSMPRGVPMAWAANRDEFRRAARSK